MKQTGPSDDSERELLDHLNDSLDCYPSESETSRLGDRQKISIARAIVERGDPFADSDWLVLVEETGAEHRFVVADLPVTIGRGEESDYPLQDTAMSRPHIRLERCAALVLVRDLNSQNGTYLNGERLEDFTTLREGDQLELGKTTFIVRRG